MIGSQLSKMVYLKFQSLKKTRFNQGLSDWVTIGPDYFIIDTKLDVLLICSSIHFGSANLKNPRLVKFDLECILFYFGPIG